MALKAPTLVIFDMDGTTIRHLNPRMLHALEWIDSHIHRVKSIISWLFKRGGKGDPMRDWEEYDKIKKPKLLVRRALHKILQRKEVDMYVEPCPGAYLVLDLLKEKNIPMALASNSLGEGYGHEIIDAFDFEKYFTATVFREDIRKSKPSPDGIILALKKTGVTLTENDVIWHIGDQSKDIKAAIAAADHLPCPVVPIAYGLNAAFTAIETGLGPDHIIPSFFDINDRLKKLLKPKKKAAKA